jgi:8-oxo-dGTP diphosphatase
MGREIVRAPVLAAGGIVLRRERIPLVAVVRLRKRNEWVLPKGKLDAGETPRQAAEREVLEETGHDVAVHEFLGTLVYESGGRSKVVHYWRMETSGEQVYDLMSDVTAVDWLPLDAAVERLSRGYERAFLANVGPLAVASAVAAAKVARRPKPKRPAAEKRRSRQAVVTPPSFKMPVSVSPRPALPIPAIAESGQPLVVSDVVEIDTRRDTTEAIIAPPSEPASPVSALGEPETLGPEAVETVPDQPRNLVQKVRDWLRRAA